MLMRFGSLVLQREQPTIDLHSAYDPEIHIRPPSFEIRITGSFDLTDPFSKNNPDRLMTCLSRREPTPLYFRTPQLQKKYKLPEGMGLTSEDEEWCKEFGIGEYTTEEGEEIIIRAALITAILHFGKVQFECDGQMEHHKL